MIIDSKYYYEHGYVKGFFIVCKITIKQIIKTSFLNLQKVRKKKAKAMLEDTESLLVKYPALTESEDSSLRCISCNLCQVVCPTNCITIQESKSFNMQKSLQMGPVPETFKVKLKDCIQCEKCEDVCPADAIKLLGEYDIYTSDKEEWNLVEFPRFKTSSFSFHQN